MHRGGIAVRSVVLATARTTVLGTGLGAGPSVAAGPGDGSTQVEPARPDNTAIRGGCHGSSGRFQLTYGPHDNGVIPFRIDLRHVTDGGWSVSGELDVSEQDRRLFLGGHSAVIGVDLRDD